MLIADLAGFAVAVGGVYLLNTVLDIFTYRITDLKYGIILLFCLILLMTSKLYPGIGINPAEEIKLVVQYISAGFLVGIIFFVTIQGQWKPNILAFFLVGVISQLTILGARWSTRILSAKLGIWGEPVVIAGRGDHIEQLSRYFLQRHRLGFYPVFALAERKDNLPVASPVPVVDLDELLVSASDRFESQGISTVLIDFTLFADTLKGDVKGLFTRMFHHVVIIWDIEWLEGASISIHDFEGLKGIEARRNILSPLEIAIKRGMDLFLSVLLGIVTLPLILLAAVLIRLDSPGSVFFSQDRIGKNGHKIRIYKLRTMKMDPDSMLEKYLENQPHIRQEWEQNQKLSNDPRVTRIGRLLRKYSIDELPQLYNVFKGDMSLVGPRPIMMNQTELYGKNMEIYRAVKPGLTGLWQVSGRNRTTFIDRAHFDRYYVRNWSVWLDIYIVLRTAWVVITRDGAY